MSTAAYVSKYHSTSLSGMMLMGESQRHSGLIITEKDKRIVTFRFIMNAGEFTFDLFNVGVHRERPPEWSFYEFTPRQTDDDEEEDSQLDLVQKLSLLDVCKQNPASEVMLIPEPLLDLNCGTSVIPLSYDFWAHRH